MEHRFRPRLLALTLLLPLMVMTAQISASADDGTSVAGMFTVDQSLYTAFVGGGFVYVDGINLGTNPQIGQVVIFQAGDQPSAQYAFAGFKSCTIACFTHTFFPNEDGVITDDNFSMLFPTAPALQQTVAWLFLQGYDQVQVTTFSPTRMWQTQYYKKNAPPSLFSP